jgi:hypothetical protein
MELIGCIAQEQAFLNKARAEFIERRPCIDPETGALSIAE